MVIREISQKHIYKNIYIYIYCSFCRRFGVEGHFLTPSEIQERYPLLKADDIQVSKNCDKMLLILKQTTSCHMDQE